MTIIKIPSIEINRKNNHSEYHLFVHIFVGYPVLVICRYSQVEHSTVMKEPKKNCTLSSLQVLPYQSLFKMNISLFYLDKL